VKIFLWLLFLFAGLVLYVAVNQYLFCPQYSFSKSKPFSGLQFFNPYQNADSTQWRLCNFHAHVHAWGGLTNGNGTAAACWHVYDSLGYDVHSVSNYEEVDDYGNDQPNYVPAYEHGYNFMKNHHGVLGTHHVEFGDYLFPQTLSNKQHMLDCLNRDDSAVIAINHPVLRNGFPALDFQFLAGYDLIEVLRSTTHSFPQWDSALSSAHRVFIIADDDMHDYSKPDEVGRNCTWINAAEVTENNILQGLKSGNAYGMIIASPEGETMAQKIQRFKKGFPKLNSLQIINDTLRVSVSVKAKVIQLIGQGGKKLLEVHNDSTASYPLQSIDTYIRTQIDFDDGTSIFLNPVFRNDEHATVVMPSINRGISSLLWAAGVFLLVLYLFIVFRILRRKPSAKQSS
jgi:hypothetical protein